MGDLLELLYDVLFRPAEGLKAVAQRKPVPESVLIYLFTGAVTSWLVFYNLRAEGAMAAVGMVVVIEVLFGLLCWVAKTAIFHLGAEWAGGQGSGKALFAALGFIRFPQVFLAPIWLLSAFLPSFIRSAVFGLTAFCTGLWILLLEITAIKTVYNLSGSRALVLYIVPWIAGLGIAVLTGVLVVMAVMNLITTSHLAIHG